MATIKLELSSDDAELLIFALALAHRQTKVGVDRMVQTQSIAEQIAVKAGECFGWFDGGKDMFMRRVRPIKNVSIRLYDIPPE
jgi:hypothetical protein